MIYGQNSQNLGKHDGCHKVKAHRLCRALQRVVAIHQRGVKDVVAVVNVVAVVADDGAARSFVGRIVEMAFSLSKDLVLLSSFISGERDEVGLTRR